MFAIWEVETEAKATSVKLNILKALFTKTTKASWNIWDSPDTVSDSHNQIMETF